MSNDLTTLTVADVARKLGLSRRKIYELVWAGELGHYRIGDGRGRDSVCPAPRRGLLGPMRGYREGRLSPRVRKIFWPTLANAYGLSVILFNVAAE